uniref:Major facilitator superfamily (MFS) profile domain-containing protein n=1 Tax=Ciona intestinalis TaxID=7719 RepID=H2XMT1_CIOIN
WIVLCMGFLSNFLTWGVTFSVGVLYAEWVSYFGAPMGEVAFAGGIPVAVGCGLDITGPIYGILINKLQIRTCGIIGGVTMCLGLSVSYFARNVITLCITFGVIAGFGCGLASLASCSIINKYFLRQRTLAESVCGSGLSAGVFAMSAVQRYIISEYTWQGAMLIFGGICLNNTVIAMFFIPPQKLNISEVRPSKESNNEIGITSICNTDCLNLRILIFTELSFFKRSIGLYRNITFLRLITSHFLGWLCLFIPYVHLVERARLSGLDENTSAWVAATIGLAGFTGRPITGAFFNYAEVHPRIAYALIQILCGISVAVSPFWSNKIGLFMFAAAFGFLSNGYGLIKASAAVMLGCNKFVDAFSWMLMFEGLGVLLGPPMAGWFYDVTQSYDWGFRVAGIGLIISGLIL